MAVLWALDEAYRLYIFNKIVDNNMPESCGVFKCQLPGSSEYVGRSGYLVCFGR